MLCVARGQAVLEVFQRLGSRLAFGMQPAGTLRVADGRAVGNLCLISLRVLAMSRMAVKRGKEGCRWRSR